MLTLIASTKSTVLGVRLDHERRAWIESTAAAQGLSVRGLVERMIDEARTAEAEGRDPLIALRQGAVDSAPLPGAPPAAESGAATAGGSDPNGLGPETSADGATSTPAPELTLPFRSGESPCDEVAYLFSLSGQMVRGVARLTFACVRTAGNRALFPLRAWVPSPVSR